jgi:hypothetical protein
MHAHTYLGSLPLYMLTLIMVINWDVFLQLISFNWQGHFSFILIERPHGSPDYITNYLIFMCIFCVFPYIEENIRCLSAYQKKEVN